MWSLLQMIGWPFLIVRNFLALTVATASIQLWQQKLEVFRPELCCHAASHYVAVDQHHWKQPNKTLASRLRFHIDSINAWNDDYTQKCVNDCLLSWELRGQPCPCVLDAAPACTICFVTKHSYELRIYTIYELKIVEVETTRLTSGEPGGRNPTDLSLSLHHQCLHRGTDATCAILCSY